jgi:hypothetical protein
VAFVELTTAPQPMAFLALAVARWAAALLPETG